MSIRRLRVTSCRIFMEGLIDFIKLVSGKFPKFFIFKNHFKQIAIEISRGLSRIQ